MSATPTRSVRNLRICVTENCNLKCFFCHREWDPSSGECVKPEEVRRIAEVASSLGVERVKITGGEPLTRRNIVDIVREVSPFFRDVSLVTNGILLYEYAWRLREAGLSRVNVNLPSLDSSKYREITGGGDINMVFKGIEAAIEAGLSPIKINMVVLRNVNEHEIKEMLDYSCSIGAVLQLIELQPTPNDRRIFEKFHMELAPIERLMASKAVEKILNSTGQRDVYILSGREGKTVVEIVSPTGNPGFCLNCSKLRVTCDGRLKPCLLRNDNLIDFVGLIRTGAGMSTLKERFMEAIMLKEPYYKVK